MRMSFGRLWWGGLMAALLLVGCADDGADSDPVEDAGSSTEPVAEPSPAEPAGEPEDGQSEPEAVGEPDAVTESDSAGEPDVMSEPDAMVEPSDDVDAGVEEDVVEPSVSIVDLPDCGAQEGCDVLVCPTEDDTSVVQTALIQAEEGSVVCLAAGSYSFFAELSIDVDGLTLRGAGAEESVLDFSGQLVGANGILVTADNVTLEDFRVVDPAGDGIRATKVDRITFRSLYVGWTSENDVNNGGYALYPVESTRVVVDGCEAVGASDAGIYVGQSVNALVINNKVHGNVAGIEIENTTDSEVRDNHCYDNAGGILIFDLPNLPIKHGQRAKVHLNVVEDNNRENFAQAGNIVGLVPSGTGILILASDNNEVHDNQVMGNQTMGVMWIAYTETIFGAYDDEEFDAFAEGNWIHSNQIFDNGATPQGIAGALPIPQPLAGLAWDGCMDPAADPQDASLKNCISNSGDTDYVNFDLCGGFVNVTDQWGIPVSAEPGELGAPCVSGTDCSSGHCVESPVGNVCTETCVDACPMYWECAVPPGEGDLVYVCLPSSGDQAPAVCEHSSLPAQDPAQW